MYINLNGSDLWRLTASELSSLENAINHEKKRREEFGSFTGQDRFRLIKEYCEKTGCSLTEALQWFKQMYGI